MTARDSETMSQQILEKYITEFLSQNNMCVLATCSDDIPRATPIEYRNRGIALYFVGEQGTKIKNLANNPNVSVGIYFPYTGMDSARGAQISGKATIIQRVAEEFKDGLNAYQWEKTAKEFHLQEFPKSLELIRVDPSKVELTDMSLKKKGYSPRQIWVLGK
jgi:general stress protein 26